VRKAYTDTTRALCHSACDSELLKYVAGLTVQDHINEEIARLNALEERIMNESGPDDERLQVGRPA
jgi:hypothetical protein